MQDLKDSWKNKAVFQEQLALNREQLSGAFPSHWNAFITFIQLIQEEDKNVRSLLDVGCGCGAFSEVCRRHFPDISYTGMDYSQEAVEIATETWPFARFQQKDWKDLSEKDAQGCDVLLTSALTNILPDGDDCIKYLLSLKFRHIILGRILITSDDSGISQIYKAYDLIETYKYHHNEENLFKIIEDNGYEESHVKDGNTLHIKLDRGQLPPAQGWRLVLPNFVQRTVTFKESQRRTISQLTMARRYLAC